GGAGHPQAGRAAPAVQRHLPLRPGAPARPRLDHRGPRQGPQPGPRPAGEPARQLRGRLVLRRRRGRRRTVGRRRRPRRRDGGGAHLAVPGHPGRAPRLGRLPPRHGRGPPPAGPPPCDVPLRPGPLTPLVPGRAGSLRFGGYPRGVRMPYEFQVTATSTATPEELFRHLAVPEAWGAWGRFPTPAKQIRKGDTTAYGVGTVKKIWPATEQTVAYEPY